MIVKISVCDIWHLKSISTNTNDYKIVIIIRIVAGEEPDGPANPNCYGYENWRMSEYEKK